MDELATYLGADSAIAPLIGAPLGGAAKIAGRVLNLNCSGLLAPQARTG